MMKGFGRIAVEGSEINCEEGGMIFIEPHEKYFWEGTLTLLFSHQM